MYALDSLISTGIKKKLYGIKSKSYPSSVNEEMVGAMLAVGHFKVCCRMNETVIFRGILDLQSQSLSLRFISTI